jgi:hypothetical protein
VTLADLRELCDRFVPTTSRHHNSISGSIYKSTAWWPAHELGHLIVAAKRDIGKPMFGIDEDSSYSAHYCRCMEIAAMHVSRRLLTAVGRPDLADVEAEDTDLDTLYYDDRGDAKGILRKRRALKIPRTRKRLAVLLAARVAR